MMTKMVRVLALAFAMVAVSAQAATTTKAPADSSSGSSGGGGGTMSVGDGTTVSSKSETTVFLGTEYDPTKCVLQFNSLQCKVGKNDDCGALNGYPLECVKVGRQNGKDKNQCQCRANETESCQNSTAPDVGGVPQFGDCSNGRQCVDSYGHVPSKLELRICAEKVHCVKEINTTATVKAEICHTCRSCIAQNDANNAKLTDKRRFDCTTICPKEILDSIAQRNKEGVGIADELSSGEDSASGSGEEGSSSGGEGNETASPAAGSKAGAGKSAAVAPLSATAVVGSIVLASLSAAALL